MDKKTVDTICWWIPFRKLRDAIRDSIYEIYYKMDKIIVQNVRIEARAKLSLLSKRIIKESREQKIIASLTTYPERIADVDVVIYSLLNQSVLADKIILWLSNEEFPNGLDDVPEHIVSLQRLGVEICFCKNIKSYKKLIYSLKKFPNDIIITFDDDHYYSHKCIENLYNAYLKNSEFIHTSRAYKITFNDKNEIDNYNNWIKEIKYNKTNPSYLNFILGGGGTLYTKNLLNIDIVKEELFTNLSPMGDDIWFWSMAVLNNTKINVVYNDEDIYQIIDLSFDKNWSSLWKTNVRENYNDKQLEAIFKHYPDIKNKILAEAYLCQK